MAPTLRWPGWRLAALLLAWLGLATAAAGAPQQLQRARSAVGDGAAFPVAASAIEVSLPDDWARSRPGSSGPVWYRVGFVAAAGEPDDRLRGLYIARVCTNFEVHLNGRLVFSGGRMREPVTHNCQHPQLVPLPAGLITAGTNLLDVKVAGLPLAEVGSRQRAGHLSALEIGWHDELASRHARSTLLAVWVPQAISATLLLMGGFLFVMGFAHRRQSHLAYFGALSVGLAFLEARLWLRPVPVADAVAEFLLAALLPFITLAAVQFLLRHAKRRIHWVDVALPLQCAAGPLSLVLAGPGRLYAATMSWALLFALEVAAAATLYLWLQWQRRPPLPWPALVMLAATLLAATIEGAAQALGVRTWATQAAHLAMPLLLVIVGLRLVQQHGRALLESEQGRAHLEQRIREATAEIEHNFRQLSELRVEQVTERERKRIAADLHDDLGAKLLTIVHTSESDRISSLAREALEEMRLSVRGLTGKAVQLSDALGDWRVEVVSRLSQSGIECEWSAPDDQELPQRLSARAYVQTTRILREATSNIIKHSGASRCTVHCAVAEGDFQLVIQDNGNGISPEVELRLDRGHGLASMKHRAKQLQGQCLVESGPGYGTVIRLTLPMDRAMAPP